MSEADTRAGGRGPARKADEVIGRFQVEKLLGEGGMGRVVLARDPLLRRVVAVKTLLDPHPHTGLRFTEEAQITGQLDHPNIIPVHVFDEAAGTPYLAMRFVQGRDLKALVKSFSKREAAKAYPLRRRLRLFLKVCDAVAHAHQRGVLHRDLKPANVMLGEDDEVLVMDWGLAKPLKEDGAKEDAGARAVRERAERRRREARLGAVSSAARADGAELTQEGAVVGTPAYMPPEQASDGATIDLRADVYSLGALLYELLTHRQPYHGSSLEVIAALVTGKPKVTPARAAAPTHEIPEAVEKILEKAMAREPAARYADAGELGADIEAFLDDRPISCHKDTAREALRRLAARHRVPLVAAGVALAALVVAGASAKIVTRREAARARAEVARAEEAQREASAVGARAGRAAGRAGLSAVAEAAATEAARLAAELSATALTALPTDALRANHEKTAREVVRIRDRIARLASEAPPTPPGAGAPGEPTAADAVAAAVARCEAIRLEVDLILGRALVARRPKLALELLKGLTLGPEGPLLEALALVRRERGPEATKLLAGVKLPEGRKELAATLRVLQLLAADASTVDLLPAVEAALQVPGGPSWLLGLRAHLRAREGDLAGAQADYERALIVDPVDSTTFANRCQDLVPRYCHEEYLHLAIARHQRLLDELGETQPESHVGALIKLWHFAHLKDELDYLDELTKNGFLTPLQAARRAAEDCLVVQEWERAAGFARQALEASPDDRRALGFLAEALVELGQLEEAAKVADRGLARHRTDGQLAYARGEVARRAGDFEAGARWLELAANRSVLAHRWERLARCYLELGDRDSLERGVKAIQRGLSYDVFDTWVAATRAVPLTGDPQYHRTFGDLRRKQGDLAAAALHYQRALSAPETIPRLKEVVGTDRQDALRLAEVHEELGLGAEAHRYYSIACEDPKLADEAKRRMARLEGR